MKHILRLLLFFPLLINAQQRGEVFPHTPKNPTERVEEQGVIVVEQSLYGLRFKDEQIPTPYKKAVQRFFKESLNGYTERKTYRLKVAKKQGYIWVEGRRIITKDL